MNLDRRVTGEEREICPLDKGAVSVTCRQSYEQLPYIQICFEVYKGRGGGHTQGQTVELKERELYRQK